MNLSRPRRFHGATGGTIERDRSLAHIDFDLRDVDVPQSELGHQAEAAGRWFAGLPEAERPS